MHHLSYALVLRLFNILFDSEFTDFQLDPIDASLAIRLNLFFEADRPDGFPCVDNHQWQLPGHVAAKSAHHLVDGLIERLPNGVPENNIDRGDGLRAHAVLGEIERVDAPIT